MAKKESTLINIAEESPRANNVILHLSDLHFNANPTSIQKIKREALFNHLIERLKTDEPQWNPNIICITGDIAYSAQKKEYQVATEWVEKLLFELKINPQNVVLCPGNHDVDVKKAKLIGLPKDTKEANESLTIPIPSPYNNLFSTYTDFCNNLKVPISAHGDYESHLFGIRQINGIYFIVCNSCWFFKNKKRRILRILKTLASRINIPRALIYLDDSIDEKMRLGLNLFEYLGNHTKLSTLNQSNTIIALLHHPERYLHKDEVERDDNIPTIKWIEDRTDLIITGHSHSLPLKPSGHTINCGAGFKGPHDRNVFCLIKVESERFLCKYYSSNENRTGNKWETDGQIYPILFSRIEKIANEIVDKGIPLSLLNNVLNNEADIFPKQQNFKTNNPIAVTDELSESPINVPKLETTSIEDNLKKQIAIAQDYTGKLEYVKSFSIADDVINILQEKELFLPASFLAEIYSELASIEITRVNWLYQTKNISKDYSRTKEFYQKAKDYHGKG